VRSVRTIRYHYILIVSLVQTPHDDAVGSQREFTSSPFFSVLCITAKLSAHTGPKLTVTPRFAHSSRPMRRKTSRRKCDIFFCLFTGGFCRRAASTGTVCRTTVNWMANFLGSSTTNHLLQQHCLPVGFLSSRNTTIQYCSKPYYYSID